jgi:phosphopantetheine adenylyltransferase
MATSKNPSTSVLLLLPPIPEEVSFASLKSVYHAPLYATLHSIAQSNQYVGRRILDIALPCPHLYNGGSTTRSELYAPTQAVLAKVYKLICIISAKEGFNVEDPDAIDPYIDPRIILLAYPRDGKLDGHTLSAGLTGLEGPIISIDTLAKCERNWRTVFAVREGQGEQLAKSFSSRANTSKELVMVPAGNGNVSLAQDPPSSGIQEHTAKRYRHSAVGGTFDHLHIGHKLLLTMTVFPVDTLTGNEERAVTVGITAGELLKDKKHAEFLESWQERYLSTHNFLHGILFFDPSANQKVSITEVDKPGPNGHAILVRYPSGLTIHYVEIWDPFGPTITEETIDALVISAETRKGGNAVNSKRAEKGWKELEVFEVDVLDVEEEGLGTKGEQDAFKDKLSSSEIRKGKSEREAKARSKLA